MLRVSLWLFRMMNYLKTKILAIIYYNDEILNFFLVISKFQREILLKLQSTTTDGAATMRGQYNGLATCLENVYSKSLLHVQCYVHCLNLIMIEVTSHSPAAVSLFDLMNEIALFFSKSYKRMDIWREVT